MSARDNEPSPRTGEPPGIPAGLQVQILTEQAEEAFSEFLKQKPDGKARVNPTAPQTPKAGEKQESTRSR